MPEGEDDVRVEHISIAFEVALARRAAGTPRPRGVLAKIGQVRGGARTGAGRLAEMPLAAGEGEDLGDLVERTANRSCRTKASARRPSSVQHDEQGEADRVASRRLRPRP